MIIMAPLILMATLMAVPCVKTDIKALQMDFDCPEKVLEIRIDRSSGVLEEYVRVDLDRKDVEPDPMRTVEAANAAIRAAHWIRGKGVEADVFQWTLEDRKGGYICTIKVELDQGADRVVSGDCAGAGK